MSIHTKYSNKTTGNEIAEEFGTHAKDKFIIVTGGNIGLGFETARVLTRLGAHITLACRNQKAGEEAVKKIKDEYPQGDIEIGKLDLGNFQSIKDFAKSYRESGKPLHILINNAGIMACPKTFTSNGLETQFGVNHVGHFLLTEELLQTLKRTGTPELPARIVHLSSVANYLFAPAEGIRLDDISGENHYNAWERYGASKLANISYSTELQRRLQAENAPVISVALHPGVIRETNLMQHFSFTSAFQLLWALNKSHVWNKTNPEPNKNTQEGIATTLYCTLSPDVVPGEYYADCKVEPKDIHPKAKDPVLGQKLWDLSLKLINEAK